MRDTLVATRTIAELKMLFTGVDVIQLNDGTIARYAKDKKVLLYTPSGERLVNENKKTTVPVMGSFSRNG